MKYETHSHRDGLELLKNSAKYAPIWAEVENILASITDRTLLVEFQSSTSKNKPTSVSTALSRLISQAFTGYGWEANVNIFADVDYSGSNWRVDFAKGDICVEIAFNHAGNIAWNLIKPVLASEPNALRQEAKTIAGIIITVTDEMKILGGFDSAIGTFERYVHSLRPMQQILPTPLVILGIQSPSNFHVEHVIDGTRKVGKVVMNG